MVPAPQTERGHRHTKSSLGIADYTRPAGVYTVDKHGQPVMAAKLVQVPEVIKMETPGAPIKDKDTTYKGVHTKAGYPCHYPPESPRPVEVKHQTAYERVPGGKRLPFEVKSKP